MNAHPDTTSLHGRQSELDVVRQKYLLASEGHPQFCVVAGDAGIGKSWLLNRAIRECARGSVVVLRGNSSDAQGMPSYLPLLEALGQYVREAPEADLHGQAREVAEALVTILPELQQRLGDIDQVHGLLPEQGRLRLYEAIGRFLTTIARPRGLVLVLDDLHWADPGTLAVLAHFFGHQADARVLILVAMRSDAAGANAHLQHALVELRRLRVVTQVDLQPLDVAGLAQVATERLGLGLQPAALSLLAKHSEGNPFFAEELLEAWRESGLIDAATGVLARDVDVTTLPQSIAAAVRDRLAVLPEDTRALLRSAAIIGRSFDIELLGEVAGQAVEAVEEQLLSALDARVLTRASGTRLLFRHDKIRECLYEEVPVTRRQRLHGFIGRALEGSAAADDRVRLAELAFHYARSGDRERGRHYAALAAEQSLAAFAADDAIVLFRTALELGAADSGDRGSLFVGLGRAAGLAGNEGEASGAFAEAQAWFQQRDDHTNAGLAARLRGTSLWRQERVEEARTAFEAATTLLAPVPSAELVLTLVDLGTLLTTSLHETEAGMARCREALDIAETIGDPVCLGAAHRALGNTLVRENHLSEGIQHLLQALAAAEASNNPAEAAECCGSLAPAYFWQGAMAASEAITHRRRDFAERCHDPYQKRHIQTWLAMLAGLRGRIAEALALLDAAEQEISALDSPEPKAWLLFCRGAFALFRSDTARAVSMLGEACAAFRAMGPGAAIWYEGVYVLTLATHGDTAAALAVADGLEAMLQSVEAEDMAKAEAYTNLCQVALMLDDEERIDRCYRELLPFEGQMHDAVVDRLLAAVEARRGQWQAAEAHLDAAEALSRRESLTWDLAHLLETRAEFVEARHGDPEIARRSRLEAAELYRVFGNNTLADRLTQLAEPAPSRPAALPAGLTQREAEVLQLVAAGKSNRAIAEVLVLSDKTVENHLTNIYRKTGTDNRAAATAFAIRNDLA